MHTQYTVLHMYLQKGSVVMGFYNLGQILPVLVSSNQISNMTFEQKIDVTDESDPIYKVWTIYGIVHCLMILLEII